MKKRNRENILKENKAVVEVLKFSEDRVMSVIASSETPDRMGDVIRAKGWKLDNFKKNPVALFQHDHDKPIGTVEAWVEGTELKANIKFAPPGTTQVADDAYALYQAGILKAVSVGFSPVDDPIPLDKEMGYWGPLEFPSSELLELSLVSVPANPEALQIARSLNIGEKSYREFFIDEDRARSTFRRDTAKRKLMSLSIPR